MSDTNDKLIRAKANIDTLEQRLKSPVPAKHAATPSKTEAFKSWLQSEINKAKLKLEEMNKA